MKSLSFALFQKAVGSKLTREQREALNPELGFFEDDGTFFSFGVDPNNKKAWVSFAVGNTPKWFWNLRRKLKENGFDSVGWNCRPDSASHRIAQYYKAKIKETGECYENGQPGIECWVDLNGGRNG
jgi:hypothetical protein